MSLGSRSRAPGIVRIFDTALKAWCDDDAPRLDAALAHYTLFAIASVLLVATGIASLVFNTDAVRGEIVNQLDHLVEREGAHAVQSHLDGASQRRAGTIATTIGTVAFVVAATGAFLELQAALNTIMAGEVESECSPTVYDVESTPVRSDARAGQRATVDEGENVPRR